MEKICQDSKASYWQSLYKNPCFLNTQFSVISPFLVYFHLRTVTVKGAKKTYFKPFFSMKYLLSEGTLLLCSLGRSIGCFEVPWSFPT